MEWETPGEDPRTGGAILHLPHPTMASERLGGTGGAPDSEQPPWLAGRSWRRPYRPSLPWLCPQRGLVGAKESWGPSAWLCSLACHAAGHQSDLCQVHHRLYLEKTSYPVSSKSCRSELQPEVLAGKGKAQAAQMTWSPPLGPPPRERGRHGGGH